nr:ribose-5-phosphate isomerase RpiA [Sphingomonas jatrophae]
MTAAETERQKSIAAEAAVAEVQPGMLVGLGTGSTAAYAIAALAARVAEGLSVTTVVTSDRTAVAARTGGIPVRDMAEVSALDLAIDGVDEIDPRFRAIKGAGGAMLREKLVATAATRMIAIADASKAVEALGARPVPVELLAPARAFITASVMRLGGEAVLRVSSGAPVRTDQGNPILDCHFGAIADPAALAAELAAIPGVLGHGLFVTEVDALYLGTPDGLIQRNRRA